MHSSTENSCPWGTLKFIPSNLWTTVVTRPEGFFVPHWFSSSCYAIHDFQTLWHARCKFFGLNLKASWEDSLTNFISIKMRFLSFSWHDFPLQHWQGMISWVEGRTSLYVFTVLKRLSPFSEYYTKADYREFGNLKSEVAFKLNLFIFLSDVQAFPAIIGIFSTLVKSDFQLSVFLISTDGKDNDCKLLRAILTQRLVVGLFQIVGTKPFLLMLVSFRYVKQVLSYSRSWWN